MTRRFALLAALLLVGAAATPFVMPRVGTASPPQPPAPLVWSDETFCCGDWWYVNALAESYVDPTGHDNWRLPTITELQAAIQDGSFGTTYPDIGGINGILFWSATGSGGSGYGSWAYAVKMWTDGDGYPGPPSGEQKFKVYKTGSIMAKFVRPQ